MSRFDKRPKRDVAKGKDIFFNSGPEINPSINIDEVLTSEEPTRSSKSYYLEDNLIKAITLLAKEKKTSESKLVNDLLKHILNIK